MRWEALRRTDLWAAGAVCLLILLPITAIAFSYPLQPEDIQSAYFLGRTSNHEELTNFLKQYQHNFEYPPDQPFAYVKSVEFQTPYEQIVLRSQQEINYTKFQAVDEYRANPGSIRIRVVASLRNNYAGPAPPDDDFKVTVSQGKPIAPKDVTSTLPCDPYNPYAYSTMANCVAYTREIVLSFEAAQFSSGRVTVKTDLPDSPSQETVFNLNRLK